MEIQSTPIEGIIIIKPVTFCDSRGYFLETYHEKRYKELGIVDVFVQDNQSRSKNGVLRGLHFQVKRPQSQLITILRGHIFDVGVDLRPDSPTFGQWFGLELCDTGEYPRQLYMAPGIAHGFYVLSDFADLHYKVSRLYDAHDEGGLLWNDPTIDIKWPFTKIPEVTSRDAAFPRLKDISETLLPHFPAMETKF